MRQSILFTKTRREAPKDEVAKNATLLIRGGYIHKEMAGVYTFLPLGLRVLNNINAIIREEMDSIGGVEMLLTALQEEVPWRQSGRWSDKEIDIWFKTKLASGSEVGLGFTHEEPLTRLMREHVHSYRDLPVYPYQIQLKFRNETRSKSGILRGREFFMKDLYSFSRTQEELDVFYERCANAYMRIFERVGLGDCTYRTFASGGTFSKYSDEFQTVTDAGEDTIYIDEKKHIAVNEEVYSEAVLSELGFTKKTLKKKKAIEVGNIFKLGTRFSESIGLNYLDEKGNERPVIMGSYGIGPGRVMGTVVEVLSDEKGIVWPENLAPFKIHLLELSQGNEKIKEYADELYEDLLKEGKEVLYDDRSLRAGEKFADADLLGLPVRAVVSERMVAEGKIEVTKRSNGKTHLLSEAEFRSKK